MKASTKQAERLHRFAHDLRNRLIGLQQVLVQLREGSADPERDQLALFGEQQFFKALREVEAVMDDLGVERGSVEPVFAPVDVPDLVRAHIDLMQYRFQRKQQPLELDIQEDLIVQGDVRVLGDVLGALLSNASKFSPVDAVIAITAKAELNDVVIVVKDHGTGLSSADLESVFVRFAWLSNRPTGNEAQGRGTLALARDRMTAHRGALTVTSAGSGHGCAFTMRLPRANV